MEDFLNALGQDGMIAESCSRSSLVACSSRRCTGEAPGGKSIMRFLSITAVCSLALACGEHPPELPGTHAAPCTAVWKHYRVDSITPSASPSLDGVTMALQPSSSRRVNGLGHGWAALVDVGLALQDAIDAALLADQFDWLLSVGRCQDHARVLARPAIRAGAGLRPIDGPFVEAVGEVAGSSLAATEGRCWSPLGVLFGDASGGGILGYACAFELEEDGAGVSARFGIAVNPDEALEIIYMPLALVINELIAADQGCPEACATSAAAYFSSFDTNGDTRVSPSELDIPFFFALLLSQDVDLFATVEGMPVYWPGRDGRNDHVSAVFTLSATAANVEDP